MATFVNFTPNYYGTLIKNQQSSLIIDNLFFFVADGATEGAIANNKPLSIADETKMHNEIMYGYRLLPTLAVALCRRVDWQYGKVFAKYDSYDPNLVDKDFYVLATNRCVYKCIDNNKNSPSTQEPSTLDYFPTKLGDGYIWQYMYSLTENQLADYSTPGLMPIFIDSNVTANAVRGTVSTIDVVSSGSYTAINSGFIQDIVSANTFKIENSASPYDGIYDNSAFYISEGPSTGSLTTVTSYFSNTSGKYISTANNLNDVTFASRYEITPYVKVVGDGLVNATARAVMNNDRIDRIEMLNRGMYYTHANVELVSNAAYSTDATVSVNLSPFKGHGGSLYSELYCNYFLFAVNLDNISVDLPVDELTFSKFGFVRGLITESDPPALYSNTNFRNTVTIETTPFFGSYTKGDTIYKVNDSVCAIRVIYANTSHVIGVYQSTKRMLEDDTITNGESTSVISSIIQPDVRLVESDIVMIKNVDTTVREENSREVCQILIKVK